MNLEIKIECKGSAVGTLGWFNSVLNESELVVKNSASNGAPAMFLKDKNGKHRFICKCFDGKDTYQYKLRGNYMSCYPVEDEQLYGLFDVPLTPACEKRVNEFIDSAVEKFADWWESDK